MKKYKFDSDVIAYQHDALKEGDLGYNSYVFLNENKALLLDSTYPEQLKKVIADLKKDKIEITHVLPSHYHPDHISGIELLRDVIIYGTKQSENTMIQMEYSEEEVSKFMPTIFVCDGDTIKFGSHKFQLKLIGGHSDCSMLIEINDQYLHVGDTYMTLNNGIDCLPFVKTPNLKKHLNGIEIIKTYNDKLILMSHGLIKVNKESINSGLDDRAKYLESIINSNNQVSVEEALKHSSKPFAHMEWRKYIK